MNRLHDGISSDIKTVIVDISLLLKEPDSNESQRRPPQHSHSAPSAPTTSTAGLETFSYSTAVSAQQGRRSRTSGHPSESPAKKQSKWSPEEDALIIELRGSGMKWEDISKRLPGRSAISCRLHYQNYLERRSEWDEERKNKLARLYERFKPEMWAKVAEEMAVPWRAAEAMHWQLGEAEMARRAGVVPFSLSNVAVDAAPGSSRRSPPHHHPHSHSHSQGSTSGASSLSAPSPRFQRGIPTIPNTPRALASHRDSTPRSVPPPAPEGFALAAIGGPMSVGRGAGVLPGVAEMTTGVSPYSSPAYAASSAVTSHGSPGGMYPGMVLGPRPESAGKRRGSPDISQRESTRRRQ